MFWGFIKQHAYSFLYQYAGFTTFVISVIFGSLIELLQMTMGLGRQGDVMDIISNTIGTVAGIFTYNLLRHYTPFRSYL